MEHKGKQERSSFVDRTEQLLQYLEQMASNAYLYKPGRSMISQRCLEILVW